MNNDIINEFQDIFFLKGKKNIVGFKVPSTTEELLFQYELFDFTLLKSLADRELSKQDKFYIDVEVIYSYYLGKILESRFLEGKKDIYNIINGTCSGILESLKFCFEGKPSLSTKKMNELLNSLKPYLDFEVLNENNGKYLYRARVGKDFGRNELSYIPFEKRRLAKPQRYSIAGYPCIYFASSIYTCWFELDRPALSEFVVSQFSVKKDASVKLLDLSKRPCDIREELKTLLMNDDEKKAISLFEKYLILWPLLFISSLKKNAENPFNYEFIIPQLVFEWIRIEEEYQGVKFLSTNADSSGVGLSGKYKELYTNYAIPVVSANEDNRRWTVVEKNFEATLPINFLYGLSICNGRQSGSSLGKRNIIDVNVSDGKYYYPVQYGATDFFKVEQLLNEFNGIEIKTY